MSKRKGKRVVLGEGYLARYRADYTHLSLFEERDELSRRVPFKKVGIKGRVRLIAEVLDD